MLAPTSIKDALNQTAPVEKLQVQGWVRTPRDAKDFSFIELNDGSSLRNLQIIANSAAQLRRRCSAQHRRVDRRAGKLVASQGKGQKWELIANDIDHRRLVRRNVSAAEERAHAGVSSRDLASAPAVESCSAAVFRVRSRLAFAIHQFFPGARICLRPHADHHRQRLRRSGRTISGHHDRCEESATNGRTVRSITPRIFSRAPRILTVSGNWKQKHSPAR